MTPKWRNLIARYPALKKISGYRGGSATVGTLTLAERRMLNRLVREGEVEERHHDRRRSGGGKFSSYGWSDTNTYWPMD